MSDRRDYMAAWREKNRERIREESREYQRQYREANRERIRENQRRYREANRDRLNERLSEYRNLNRDAISARHERWRKANPDKVKQANQAYYAKNTDRAKQSAKSWRERNPERWATILKLNARKREARKKQLPAYTITAKDARRILSSPCAVDGCTATDIQFDHVIPIARGGSHGIGNLQPLCGSHNASKNDKTWMEFRLYLRRTCEMRTA